MAALLPKLLFYFTVHLFPKTSKWQNAAFGFPFTKFLPFPY